MNFSTENRHKFMNEMKNNELDVLVIGGGITGAGIILDGQSRGLQMGLIEMQDFASGTSSRSTKLIHGGLRYLKQFEIKLVAEVGKERAIVYENAPHVTTPVQMMLPFYQGGTFGHFSTSIGLKVYDFLAQVKRSERRRMLTKKETLQREPLLNQEKLKGAGVYVEYRTDDARLTLEVIKKAVELGACAVNYLKATGFIYKEKKVVGVDVVDLLTNEKHQIYAKHIVNATGPWVDGLREKDQSKKGKYLHLTKGVHLVVDQKRLPIKDAVYFDTPFKDGRMLFAIPREQKTYIGTTDTNYQGDPIEPKMTKEDLTYILNAVNGLFPNQLLTEEDVESSWAGLRPLIHEEGKDPSDISRKDEVFHSDSGLLTIAGGKLTGYRKMAEKIIDEIGARMKNTGEGSLPSCKTATLVLSGGEVGGSLAFDSYKKEQIANGQKLGFTQEEASQIVERYGANSQKIYEIIKQNRSQLEESQLPLVLASTLLYVIKNEMVIKPSDYFLRRSSWLLFNIEMVKEWKVDVLNWMACTLNWTDEMKKVYRQELEEQLLIATQAIK